MVEEVIVTDTWVTGVPAIGHLLDGIEAHPEAEHCLQGVVGTGGGAQVPHAVLFTESEEGEVDTAEALYAVVHPLPGNQGHMASEGQAPGASCPDQDQGLRSQCMVAPHLIPHLQSEQAMRNLSLHPHLGPGPSRHLRTLVLEARKVLFPTEMAPLILLGSRAQCEVSVCNCMALA